jgi:hypothetical protein
MEKRVEMISRDKVDIYETTNPLLRALYNEIQGFSKKKPEATLSAMKVKIINRLLVDIREMLKNEPEMKYLDMVDDDNLPQYSDVVIILSQYLSALEKFYNRYTTSDGLERSWLLK